MAKNERTLDSINIENSSYAIEAKGLAWRLRLLRDNVFYRRYILANAKYAYAALFGFSPGLSKRRILAFVWGVLSKIAARVKWGERALKFPFKLYFMLRFLCGKVDMPNFAISLTTKCTMRCKGCISMMQYFDSGTHCTCTLSGVKASLDALFRIVDSVQRVRVLGGEPLLHKELAQVVRFLRESPKVRTVDLVTNATLEFKEDVLEALEGTHKARVTISDYSASPGLAIPLRQEAILASLKKHNIAYLIAYSGEQNPWFDMGRIYKRGRSKEDIVRNYRACLENYGCPNYNNVISSEGVKDASLAPAGAAFICPPASALARLKGFAEFQGDFIDFATATKGRVIEFYAQDYFKACDYCHNMWEEKRFIAPAVQTKETLSVSEV